MQVAQLYLADRKGMIKLNYNQTTLKKISESPKGGVKMEQA